MPRPPEWGDPINDYTKWVVAALVTLCVLFVALGFVSRADAVGTGVSAHAVYLSKSNGFMLAGLRVDTGGKARQVRVCLGTSGSPELRCKSDFTSGKSYGLAVPCVKNILTYRLWILRLNGFPVASTYSRC